MKNILYTATYQKFYIYREKNQGEKNFREWIQGKIKNIYMYRRVYLQKIPISKKNIEWERSEKFISKGRGGKNHI